MATLKGDIRRCLENLPSGLLSHHEVLLRLSLVITKWAKDPNHAERALVALLEKVSHRKNQPSEIRNAINGA